MADILYWDTALMLAADAANGSTTFVDSSRYAQTATVVGSTQVSTLQSKFGGSSIKFDGSTAGLTLPAAVWNAGIYSRGWTIEGWVYYTGAGSGYQRIAQLNNAGFAEYSLGIHNGKLAISVNGYGTYVDAASAFPTNTWVHVSLSYLNSRNPSFAFFQDGIKVGDNGASVNITGFSIPLAFGASQQSPIATDYFSGYMDDIRILSIPRDVTNFTPPGALDLTPGTVTPAFVSTSIPLVRLGAPAPSYKTLANPSKLLDTIFGGTGLVSGTTKIKGTPDYAARRRVRLHREIDGMLIREQWSSASTGAYSFDNIDATKKYTVVTYDHEHNFRAVIADNITPDAMP